MSLKCLSTVNVVFCHHASFQRTLQWSLLPKGVSAYSLLTEVVDGMSSLTIPTEALLETPQTTESRRNDPLVGPSGMRKISCSISSYGVPRAPKGTIPDRESEPQPLNPHQYGAAIHFLLWHCFFQQDLGCKKGKSSAVVSLSSPGPCDQTLEVCSSGKLERAEPLENQ